MKKALPKRPDQHISESASFKVFSSKIPNSWIIREITERDYGIDCYIELVNNDKELTGKLISIQLKSREQINWNVTQPTKWTLSGIDIATTNYWYDFAVPVIICIIDLSTEEVFFQSVNEYVKRNFYEYNKQKIFSYKIDKNNKLEKGTGLANLLHQYFKDLHRVDFEKNLVSFFAHFNQYKEFYEENSFRDFHMGVETSRLLFARHFYYNLNFLCEYLGLPWDLLKFKEYENLGQKQFGNNYELYEDQLHQIVNGLNENLLPILKELKEIITETEMEYWISTDNQLFNFVSNISDDGEVADW